MDALRLSRQSGVSVGLAGMGLVALGVWGRREVRHALARERITIPADAERPNAPVTSATAARSLAELIRSRTLAAAGGRVYAEVEDESPEQALWIQSTTLQTALMQAYLSQRIAELTIGLGVALVAVGGGIWAAGHAQGCGRS